MLSHVLLTDQALPTSDHAVVARVNSKSEIDQPLNEFMAKVMAAIDIEIRHLVNTKHEGIIVTPVDTDSATEEGVNKLVERKLGRKLKNIGDMHVL